MTNDEYKNLKRFTVNHNMAFTDYLRSLYFDINTMFECYTLSDTVKYVRITNHFEGMIFDVLESTADGKPVRFPYKRHGNTKEEIAERLYEGDWRIYSQ